MIAHAKATRLLQRKLGAGCVRTDAASLYEGSFDSAKIPVQPAAVVKVRKEADIGVVLELANTFRVPVTTRGRGTTLTGAATPVRGGWVLDTLALNAIAIDGEAGMAHVQAGAKVGDIQRAAEAKGWFYPPDPSSKEYCTIGGNVACNAGGMHGGKYGVTRDFVISLRGFLPTGEPVQWGTATKKFSAGFNLRDLWIGSEGMLGVITGAVLKLIPQPAERWTLLTSFPDETRALQAALALFRERVQPAICEFLDRESVLCAAGSGCAAVRGCARTGRLEARGPRTAQRRDGVGEAAGHGASGGAHPRGGGGSLGGPAQVFWRDVRAR